MNGRERYAAVYGGERPDHLPIQGVGPWGETWERCFRVAWTQGRYTPSLDHGAPPDIPWDNVRYYADRYREHCLSLRYRRIL